MKRPLSTSMSQKTSLYIVLPDLHHPDHDNPSVQAVFSFMDRNKERIEGVILLGDNMSNDNISRHSKGKPRLRTRGGIAKDFSRFDKDILIPIENRIKPNIDKLFFLGNHEDWLEQWLDENPEFEGIISFDKTLHLSERGWEVVPQGDHRKVGKTFLLHGDEVGSGTNVAKKLVDAYCATVIMGHVHHFSAFTKTSVAKKEDKWIGITLPTLGTLSPGYAKGKPNSFAHGFGIIELWPNDFTNIYVPLIFNGQFSFGGELYGKECK